MIEFVYYIYIYTKKLYIKRNVYIKKIVQCTSIANEDSVAWKVVLDSN